MVTAEITRGTTPTIKFTGFTVVSPATFVNAVLTITQEGADGVEEIIIEKGFDSMTAEADSIKWTLTQEETLLLEPTRMVRRFIAHSTVTKAKANFLTSGGVRGVTNTAQIYVADNPIDEVMTEATEPAETTEAETEGGTLAEERSL